MTHQDLLDEVSRVLGEFESARANEPLFRLNDPASGRHFSLYANGVCEGFPAGATVDNDAASRFDLLLGLIQKLVAALVSEPQ